ncbi:unnamed protein product [Heligmosomoides polygyrus]|uniref:Transposase n=1 Tax=Heligmosomoides polygyrus TaxID=6339 RepID=A0A183G343_HELPZ|nr:unnamed protein product [Heligmosomoides polygyrus]
MPFTLVIRNRINRTQDEGQRCEQAGFRREFRTMDHMHTVTKLVEVSRENKPLCFTIADHRQPQLDALTRGMTLFSYWKNVRPLLFKRMKMSVVILLIY